MLIDIVNTLVDTEMSVTRRRCWCWWRRGPPCRWRWSGNGRSRPHGSRPSIGTAGMWTNSPSCPPSRLRVQCTSPSVTSMLKATMKTNRYLQVFNPLVTKTSWTCFVHNSSSSPFKRLLYCDSSVRDALGKREQSKKRITLENFLKIK